MNVTVSDPNVTMINEEVSLGLHDLPTDNCKPKLTNLTVQKSSETFCSENRKKNSLNGSASPRIPASNSFNDTLNASRPKTELKKTPSQIPKSKSRKHAQVDKPHEEKTEGAFDDKSDKPIVDRLDKPTADRSDKPTADRSDKPTADKSDGPLEQKDRKAEWPVPAAEPVTSTTLSDGSERSDNNKNVSLFGVNNSNQKSRKKVSQEIWANLDESFVRNRKRDTKSAPDSRNYHREAESQEIALQYLYDTIKYTVGPLFDKLQWAFPGKRPNSAMGKLAQQTKAALNVQQRYEFTLREISDIWKNTITLIRSVKDHTVQFVDKGDRSIDREQLILEAEMMQLAIDFAMNYSKLKMDFFIKWLSKNLDIPPPEKCELENFLDTKTFAALYSADDLDAMARTVEDLTASVLKGEEFEIE